MISVRGVTKRYGQRVVLENVSVEIRPGEITLLLGVNGAGKSTLLRSILGLVEHDGRVEVCGRDPRTDGPAARALIGYMPQTGGLHPDLTVRQTMELYAAIRRADPARIDLLLDEAGLLAESRTLVGELSGGMRQRLGFVVALVADPPVLLLDEPSASLDAASRRWLARRMRELAACGRTVLVSTHAGQELVDIQGQVLLIEDGRVTASRSADPPGPAVGPSLPESAATNDPVLGDFRPIVRKELRDALTNRWLAAFAALVGILGLAATAAGYDSVSGLGLQMFGRTTATLLNLSLLLGPLVGVLMGAVSIAGERERGTLEHLLAQPLSRTAFLLSKHAGLVVAIAAATAAGFVPAGILVAANSGLGMLPHFVLFPALAIAAAAALAGIGLLISVSCRSAVQAQGAAVGVWFTLALLYDLLLIGALATSGLAPDWLVAALLANPIDATRVLGVLALEPDLHLLGPAGAFLAERIGSVGSAIVLGASVACWVAVPVVLSAISFSWPFRRLPSHETASTHAIARWIRARWYDCLRVRRAGI